MRRHRNGWIWGGRVAAAVTIAGLAVYLFSTGLDRAGELASVLGLLVAVAALVAPYLLPISKESSSVPESVQSVANAVVGGHLTQVRSARDIQVQVPDAASPREAPASPPPAVPAEDDTALGSPGGQYINGVWVGGNLTQIHDADGDVTIR